MRKLEDVVTYTIECLPEDAPIKGNVMASDDDEADREAEQSVFRDLASGNDWAWCTIKVTARYADWSESEYLGCCSYASQAEFEADAYCADMKREALFRLRVHLRCMREELSELGLDEVHALDLG